VTPDAPAPTSHAMRVRDDLLERLVSGRYSPGARISIEDLKAEYGVSKQPIMDALRRLETTGLVLIVPQSGCRVVAYSADEVADFFGLFARFEGEVAAAAADRRTDAQLERLASVSGQLAGLDDIADAGARADGYRRLNRRFHLVIHQMAASRVMAGLSERMWDMSDFLIATSAGPAAAAAGEHHRNEEHDLIRTAITFGEPEIARAAMESHIRGSIAAPD
jgi:DNA-binding GntR family transcriptional regulator